VSELRRFDDQAIQKVIDSKLAELPADVKGTVVAHYDVTGHVVLSVYGRLNAGFSYVGTVDWNHRTGKLEGEAEIRFRW
jgi:hypothetical protein